MPNNIIEFNIVDDYDLADLLDRLSDLDTALHECLHVLSIIIQHQQQRINL